MRARAKSIADDGGERDRLFSEDASRNVEESFPDRVEASTSFQKIDSRLNAVQASLRNDICVTFVSRKRHYFTSRDS